MRARPVTAETGLLPDISDVGERGGSRAARTLEQIVALVLDGRDGDLLPDQETLSVRLGVSRTVLREALSVLLSHNMIEVHPRTGTRIRHRDEWQLICTDMVNWRLRDAADQALVRDAVELATIIEPRAAALAAARVDTAAIGSIRDGLWALQAAARHGSGLAGARAQLHQRIVAASGNRLMLQMAQITSRGLAYARPPANPAALVKRHARVLEAIERHDPEAVTAVYRGA